MGCMGTPKIVWLGIGFILSSYSRLVVDRASTLLCKRISVSIVALSTVRELSTALLALLQLLLQLVQYGLNGLILLQPGELAVAAGQALLAVLLLLLQLLGKIGERSVDLLVLQLLLYLLLVDLTREVGERGVYALTVLTGLWLVAEATERLLLAVLLLLLLLLLQLMREVRERGLNRLVL